jgi:predicted NUDIX family phosphoesterase
VSREQVLVIPASALEPLLPKFDGGVLTDPRAKNKLLEAVMAQAAFMDREAAERDESFKQVIPYCVLTRGFRDEPMYLWYKRTRKGGESRLHDKYSLGIGGHVNPVDGAAAGAGTYAAGLARELKEEVGLDVRFEYDWPKFEAAMSVWFPLHMHSHFSLLDGLSKPEQIAGRLLECGYEGSALTDHGSSGARPC